MEAHILNPWHFVLETGNWKKESEELPSRPLLGLILISLLHLPAMLGLNGTPFQPATLQLTGIPGMHTGQAWVALIFCFLYFISIAGNLSILALVIREPPLHQPMYYFLSMLSLNDLGVSLSTLPTVLATFCFNYRHVGFDACLVQMFFIHTFSFME